MDLFVAAATGSLGKIGPVSRGRLGCPHGHEPCCPVINHCDVTGRPPPWPMPRWKCDHEVCKGGSLSAWAFFVGLCGGTMQPAPMVRRRLAWLSSRHPSEPRARRLLGIIFLFWESHRPTLHQANRSFASSSRGTVQRRAKTSGQSFKERSGHLHGLEPSETCTLHATKPLCLQRGEGPLAAPRRRTQWPPSPLGPGRPNSWVPLLYCSSSTGR
jgi:hypothetical protein